MKKVIKKGFDELQLTLMMIAAVCLYSTDHYIGGFVLIFFIGIGLDADKKRKEEKKEENKTEEAVS